MEKPGIFWFKTERELMGEFVEREVAESVFLIPGGSGAMDELLGK